MNERKPIMWMEREDFCPYCKSRKALMLYDKQNQILNYPMLLDEHREDVLTINGNSKAYKHFRCRRCGTYFFIDWSGKLPKAMHPDFYNTFMNNFKMQKIL